MLASLLVSALTIALAAPAEPPSTTLEAAPAPTETSTQPEPDADPAEPEPSPQPEPPPQPGPPDEPEPPPQPPSDTTSIGKPRKHFDKRRMLTGFGEFETQIGRLDGVFTTILGGTAALVLRDRFIFGGSGYGMVYLDRAYPSSSGERALELAYGGAVLGVFTARTPRITSSFNLMLGGGRTCLRFTKNEKDCDSSSNIFVSQTELALYLKLAWFARLGVSIGYRFIGAAEDWSGPGNWDLAGGYGGFKLAFGKF